MTGESSTLSAAAPVPSLPSFAARTHYPHELLLAQRERSVSQHDFQLVSGVNLFLSMEMVEAEMKSLMDSVQV